MTVGKKSTRKKSGKPKKKAAKRKQHESPRDRRMLDIAIVGMLLLAAYFWDAVSLLVLFRDSQRPLSYVAVLRARGQSYVFSVVNFGLGQGRLAWLIARAQDQSLLVTVARCLMLIYVDLYVLLTLALGGALLSDHPGASLEAIGISCGGPLDSRRGLILSPPNLLGWDQVEVLTPFRQSFGVPVALQNDANACALAEWRWGAGRGYRRLPAPVPRPTTAEDHWSGAWKAALLARNT